MVTQVLSEAEPMKFTKRDFTRVVETWRRSLTVINKPTLGLHAPQFLVINQVLFMLLSPRIAQRRGYQVGLPTSDS